MNILKKYKETIMYLTFGVFTVVVNIFVYAFLTRITKLDFMLSNCIAWVAAVLFAYITNKFFVFESKDIKINFLIKEFSSFVSCRLLSGIMEMVIMYIMIDIMFMNDFVVKIFTNILVIILNYILSKLVIFKERHI